MLKISLNQWQIFCAVIDHGGYAKAAEILNRSHSSLHHAVTKLQDQLAVKLVEVQGKSLTLTEIGKVMHRHAKNLIEEAENIEKLAGLLDEGWETEITLAIENVYPKGYLPPILTQFYAENSTSRLQIKEVVLQGAVHTIRQKQADIVITPLVPTGFLGHPLMVQRLRPFVHKTNPLHQKNSLTTVRQLRDHLQVVIRDNAPAQRDPAPGWLRSEQRWTVDSFYQAKEIMRCGQGFCWAPEEIFEKEDDFVALEGEMDLTRVVPLHLVLPHGDVSGPGVQLLTRLFKEAHQRPDMPL
ncbi:MAG: LysR family transcriptional regulator [Sneathiella sp.]|nr:LysR family transcriptional regulator [Sneathiella sp.]